MIHALKDPSRQAIAKAGTGFAEHIVVYGCGLYGRKVLEALRADGIEPLAFCDAAANKWGKTLEGLPILSPDEAGRSYGQEALFLVAIASFSLFSSDAINTVVGPALSAAGVENIAYIPSLYERIGLFDCRSRGIDPSANVLEIDGARTPNFFLDSDSAIRDCFGFVVSETLHPDSNDEPYDRGDESGLRRGDVVLDCGANLGVFSVYAAARGCVVHAFEPIPATFERLRRAADLHPGKIIPHLEALGAKPGRAVFSVSSLNAIGNRRINMVEPGAVEVTVSTVDNFVAVNALARVDFIKADIEGDERNMLRGAAATLERFAPRLAICSYHLPDDPEMLTAIIRESNPRYRVKHIKNKLFAWPE